MKKIKKILRRLKESKSKHGIKGLFHILNKHLFRYPRYYYSKLKPLKKFKFNKKEYNYFHNNYNFSWENERTVEVPIILDFVQKFKDKEILEVGNVLQHYVNFKHDILDKYEKAKGVINQDVVAFNPDKKYDLIISISTLEHVGWDENPKQENKISSAIEKLKKLTKPKGIIAVTIPIGHNLYFDDLIKNNKNPFTEEYFIKRVSKDNRWKQVKKKEIKNTKYGFPFPYANVVFVGIISIPTKTKKSHAEKYKKQRNLRLN